MRRYLLIAFILLFTFTSCNKNKKLHEYEDGYFKYVIRNKEVYITGFTEEGKQVKYMEFPETIDNKEVVGIGYKYKGKYYNDFEYSNILKIYVNEKNSNIFISSMKVSSKQINLFSNFIYVYYSVEEVNNHYINNIFRTYTSCYSYNLVCSTFKKEDNIKIPYNMYVGNINYNYNYENAPYDGIYFTDYWNGTIVKYIPKDPIREGYKFMGWYKEKECINLWDFEKDKCKDLIYARDIMNIEDYEYDGINLYAKWEIV